MILTELCTEYNGSSKTIDGLVNDVLIKLQKEGCRIIDIKFSTSAFMKENQEGYLRIEEINNALIIYDDMKTVDIS